MTTKRDTTSPLGSARQVGRNAASLLGAQYVNYVVSFLFGIVVARMLGVRDFGEYTFVLSIYAILTIVVNLGLHSLVIREVSRDRDSASRHLSAVAGLKVASALAALGVMLLVAAIVPALRSFALPLVLVTLALLFDALSDSATIVFQAFERFLEPAGLAVAGTLLFAVLGLAALFSDLGWQGLVGAMVLAKVLQAGLACILLGRRLPEALAGIRWPSRRFALALLVTALPFLASKLFYLIYFRIDMVMLRALADEYSVGLYGCSYKFLNLALAAAGAIAAALFPVMSVAAAQDQERARRLFRDALRFMLVTGLAGAGLAWCLASDLLVLVYGEQYRPGNAALEVLAWTMIPLFCNLVFSNMILALNRERAVVLIGAVALVLNVALNAIVIPLWRELGAAISTGISEIVVMFGYVIALRTAGVARPQGLSFLGFIGSALALLIPMLLVRDQNAWLAAGVGLVSFGVAVLTLRVVKLAEISALVRSLRG